MAREPALWQLGPCLRTVAQPVRASTRAFARAFVCRQMDASACRSANEIPNRIAVCVPMRCVCVWCDLRKAVSNIHQHYT